MNILLKSFCVIIFLFFQNTKILCSINSPHFAINSSIKLIDTIETSTKKFKIPIELITQKNNPFNKINKGINHYIVQYAFNRLSKDNIFIDSLINNNSKTKHSEAIIYLTNVKYLLNSEININKRYEYFFNQTKSKKFSSYSNYLKFSIRFNLYLIFNHKNKHLLSLEELLLAIKFLENSKSVENDDLAYLYNLIAYTAFNYNGDSKISKKAYLTALKIYKQNKQYDKQVKTIYNLSLMAYGNNQYKESFNYCKKAIEIINLHIPNESRSTWTGVYPAYIMSIAQTTQSIDTIQSIFYNAKNHYKNNTLSENDYNNFVLNSLEALVLCNMDKEYNTHIKRLLQIYTSVPDNQFALSKIYNAIAMYQNRNNDPEERESQIKRMDINFDQYETNYYNIEYESALNRLIEIDEKNNDKEQLLFWYKKKLDLNVFKKNKNTAHSIQVDYWSEKNLNYAEREVIFNKEKLKYSRTLSILISIFSFISLIVLYKIWTLWKTSKSQEQALSISHDQLDQKNQELLNANKIIKNMNLELEADLKNLLLITSSNKIFFKKLIESIDEHITDLSAKNLLKSIIRRNQEDNIFEEIDHKFLLLNESFFSALSRKFPKLTNNELKLCALIKMNLSTKEIAHILYQTPGTAKVAKSRLRKKLNLTGTDVNIVTFLNTISEN